MAQPTPYDRQSSFTLLAQENPSTPYTGADLDAEFNAVKVTLDELLANIAIIQRSDGYLANQSVGPDQLAPALSIGFNPPTAWEALTAYTRFDAVFESGSFYTATADHTSSSSFEDDFNAGKWTLAASFDEVLIDDGSITTDKLADLAVTSAKLASGAVTSTKMGTAAVLSAAIASLAVTAEKLASNAVTADKITDEAVTVAKLASAALRAVGALTPAANKVAYFTSSTEAALADFTAFGRSLAAAASAAAAKTLLGVLWSDVGTTPTTLAGYGIADAEALGATRGINTQTASSYTTVLGDAGKMVAMNNAGANTVTIPPNADVAYPTNTYMHVGQYGAGQTTIAAGSGVTIRSPDGLKIVTQYGVATIVKIGTNEWWVEGRLES